MLIEKIDREWQVEREVDRERERERERYPPPRLPRRASHAGKEGLGLGPGSWAWALGLGPWALGNLF